MGKDNNMVKANKSTKPEKIYYATSEQKDIKSFITVIIVVVLCVGIVYLATRVFVTKDLKKTTDETETVEGKINYDKAIVGNMLNKAESEYYVVIYDTGGSYMSDMSVMVSDYNNKEKHLHIYTVDLSNELNKSYYDVENENVKATSVDDFKFGDITLIKVKDGKVNKYIVDLTKMKKELGV